MLVWEALSLGMWEPRLRPNLPEWLEPKQLKLNDNADNTAFMEEVSLRVRKLGSIWTNSQSTHTKLGNHWIISLASIPEPKTKVDLEKLTSEIKIKNKLKSMERCIEDEIQSLVTIRFRDLSIMSTLRSFWR